MPSQFQNILNKLQNVGGQPYTGIGPSMDLKRASDLTGKLLSKFTELGQSGSQYASIINRFSWMLTGAADPLKRFEKLVAAINAKLEKQGEVLDKRFEGASAFAKSNLAKSLGLDKVLQRSITKGRAAAGDPTAVAKLRDEILEHQKERQARIAKQEKERQTEISKVQKQKQAEVEGRRDTFMAGGRGLFGAAGAFASGQFGHAGGKLIGAIGNFAGAFSQSGKSYQAITGFGKLVSDTTDKLKEWSEHLKESDKRIAMISAPMAMVQAQAQIGNIMLDIQRGRERAPIAREREISRLAAEQAALPRQNFLYGVGANLEIFFNRVTAGIDLLISGQANITNVFSKIAELEERQRRLGGVQMQRASNEYWRLDTAARHGLREPVGAGFGFRHPDEPNRPGEEQ